jgi:hypothetical protein
MQFIPPISYISIHGKFSGTRAVLEKVLKPNGLKTKELVEFSRKDFKNLNYNE